MAAQQTEGCPFINTATLLFIVYKDYDIINYKTTMAVAYEPIGMVRARKKFQMLAFLNEATNNGGNIPIFHTQSFVICTHTHT